LQTEARCCAETLTVRPPDCETLSTTDKFTIMYSNVGSLPNKKQELVAFINNAPCKPKLIALTEIKHKKINGIQS